MRSMERPSGKGPFRRRSLDWRTLGRRSLDWRPLRRRSLDRRSLWLWSLDWRPFRRRSLDRQAFRLFFIFEIGDSGTEARIGEALAWVDIENGQPHPPLGQPGQVHQPFVVLIGQIDSSLKAGVAGDRDGPDAPVVLVETRDDFP